MSLCGCLEDRDNLFFQCEFYGQVWSHIYVRLGLSTVHYGYFLDHLLQKVSPSFQYYLEGEECEMFKHKVDLLNSLT